MSSTNFDIEVGVTIGGLENVLLPSAGMVELRGIVTDQWGIDPTGQLYFDPDGVPASDVAVMSVNANGDLVLTQPTSAALLTLHAGGRRFVARPRYRVQRAYQRDSGGRLFRARPQARPERVYRRRADGRLFPHAPIHAGESIQRRRPLGS